MPIRYCIDQQQPQQLTYDSDAAGRKRMILRLKSLAEKHGAKRIVFAYEASGLGHGLSDQLTDEGIECYVLSPTHLPKTPKSARLKTDARDAQMLLEQLRGFVLAGNSLPVVWTPPQRLRDDAAYLGLCPSSHESGEKNDRKGRITRQGPARLRKLLCQAAWVSVVRCKEAAAEYQRIRQNQKHRSKKALVAMMRKLGIKMWHRALACGVNPELVGRDRPTPEVAACC